jgi:hypothetical protein
MLRVLAEQADVYRTGSAVYLVADYRYPHNVLPFTTRTAAINAQKDSAANYGLFGPYVTPPDPIAARAPRVISVTVKLGTPTGDQQQTVTADQADALFFNLSALDKFVIPYYQRTLGTAYAQALRTKLIDRLNRVGYMRHCFSWMCDLPGRPLRVFAPVQPGQGPLGPTPGAQPMPLMQDTTGAVRGDSTAPPQ